MSASSSSDSAHGPQAGILDVARDASLADAWQPAAFSAYEWIQVRTGYSLHVHVMHAIHACIQHLHVNVA